MSTSETNRNAATTPRTGKPAGSAKKPAKASGKPAKVSGKAPKPSGKAAKAAEPATAKADNSKSRERAAASAAAPADRADARGLKATQPANARVGSKFEPTPTDGVEEPARSEALTMTVDGVDAHEWHRLVSQAAYLRAERRGFINGSPEQDWLEAEEEVRRTLRRADG